MYTGEVYWVTRPHESDLLIGPLTERNGTEGNAIEGGEEGRGEHMVTYCNLRRLTGLYLQTGLSKTT